VNVTEVADGHLVEAPGYRLHIAAARPIARLDDATGRPLGQLALLAAVHTTDGLDGTVATSPARLENAVAGGPIRFVVPAESTRWAARRIVIECHPDEIRLRAEIAGRGRLADVHLLGGYHPGDRRSGSGFQRSAMRAATLFSPNPEDPKRVVLGAGEPTTIGVVGGGGPGRGHWFFTPAPLCLGFSAETATHPTVIPDGPWTMVGLAAPLRELAFTDLLYEPLDGGFALRLAYEGETLVDGEWSSPEVVVAPGQIDPYTGLAAYAAKLRARGLAPAAGEPRAGADGRPGWDGRPDWWEEPIFCGWGAQCHLATLDGSHPADHATQAVYDRFLADLAARGIRPGTIVVDDRWQAVYGTSEPDLARWPDLTGWIEQRHAEGRRVLLWWKAWDPEGVPAELCVTTAVGHPVTVDPSNPAYRSFLAERVRRLLAPPPDGLGADGLKIDFTALTPSGPGLRRHGREWGIALLHLLLATIHTAAKSARPDAFVIAHAPNPAFADVADAVRLNDLLRLDDLDREVDVVAQMRHRAGVARAACPDLLIETDDWGMPDRRRWRAYLEAKGALGIPSLYYTTHLDLTGEPLRDEDVTALQAAWSTYRRSRGLRRHELTTTR
jgi:hypothetical protein